MPTRRLYYTDSYTTSFDARPLERITVDHAPAVILDQTCFYPTSGGQPHDVGTLNGVPVVDVFVREADGSVVHVLQREAPGDVLHGVVDWPRRFDHMRHHSGQHILSQAFIRVAEAETVGFHLGTDSITIDLNKPQIDPEAVDAAEDLANAIVAENRPVHILFPSDDEVEQLDLRKVPDVDGKLRVIDIDGFDVTACGGTHVAHTAEVGLIKVLRVDRRGDTVRVEFRCGTRALHDYREKNALLNRLAAELTTSYLEIPASLNKLRDENKALTKEVRTLRSAVLAAEAGQLWRSAAQENGIAWVVLALDDRDPGDVRQLAQHLITHPQTVALLGIAGEKAQLIAARSDDLSYDMVAALKAGLDVWDVSRGGGRPSFAQGGGVAATLDRVQSALEAAQANLRSQQA